VRISLLYDVIAEKSNSLFAQEGNAQVVRGILAPAFERRSHEMNQDKKTFNNLSLPYVWSTQLRHSPIDLPEIPDVAVQYRCGDNTQVGYGLLAWTALLKNIPQNTTSIYLMTENPHRQTASAVFEKCNNIIKQLAGYLYLHFSSASVVVLRGGSVIDDMTRLAMAPYTICSPSTFCFWPAVASKTASYYPPSALIFSQKGTLQVTSQFHWMTTPEEVIIPGKLLAVTSDTDLIKMLKHGQVIIDGHVIAGVRESKHIGTDTKHSHHKTTQGAANFSKNPYSTHKLVDASPQSARAKPIIPESKYTQQDHSWIFYFFLVLAVLFACRNNFRSTSNISGKEKTSSNQK
jgi:hypothetical protein